MHRDRESLICGSKWIGTRHPPVATTRLIRVLSQSGRSENRSPATSIARNLKSVHASIHPARQSQSIIRHRRRLENTSIREDRQGPTAHLVYLAWQKSSS